MVTQVSYLEGPNSESVCLCTYTILFFFFFGIWRTKFHIQIKGVKISTQWQTIVFTSCMFIFSDLLYIMWSPMLHLFDLNSVMSIIEMKTIIFFISICVIYIFPLKKFSTWNFRALSYHLQLDCVLKLTAEGTGLNPGWGTKIP